MQRLNWWVLFISITLLSCSKGEGSKAEPEAQPVNSKVVQTAINTTTALEIGEIQSGSAVIVVDVQKIRTGFSNWWLETQGPAGGTLNLQAPYIREVSLQSGGKDYYLACEGTFTDAGGTVSSRIAMCKLTLAGNSLSLAANSVTHTCSGNPCSLCNLGVSETGEVTGCSCSQNDTSEAGHCDHSVSVGGAASSLPVTIIEELEA